jgi:predicted RNA-binding protein with PIN domain
VPLLVDAYNVMHATMPPSLAGLDEAGLCRALGRSPWAGDRIVVVCDGVAKPLGVNESPDPRVDLVFSGPRRSADDVIIAMIDADTAPRRLTVVSTDREIRRAARRRRATSLTAEQFIQLLAAARSGGSSSRADEPPPAGPLDEAEVERWLRRFGVDEDALHEDDSWWRQDDGRAGRT